jgi:hypothetical protein
MWMRILAKIGFPVLGEAFPAAWSCGLEALNPGGFYESPLREGVNWQTNPDPATGVYLHPNETRRHAVKIFPMGLVRTDFAFLDRVLVTYRPWRAQLRSRLHFSAVEEAQHRQRGHALPPHHDLHVAEWFRDVYLLFEDVERRRYPVHVQYWPALLADPERTLPGILSWLGAAPGRRLDDEMANAVAVVRAPGARNTAPVPDDLEAQVAARVEAFERLAGTRGVAILDRLDAAVAEGHALEDDLLGDMNHLIHVLLPHLRGLDEARAQWLTASAEEAIRPSRSETTLANPITPS